MKCLNSFYQKNLLTIITISFLQSFNLFSMESAPKMQETKNVPDIGAKLPTASKAIVNLKDSLLNNDDQILDREKGIDFIKYLYENGVVFRLRNIDLLSQAIKDYKSYMERQFKDMVIANKNIEQLEEIINYLKSKISKQQN